MVGDYVLAVNGTDVTSIPHSEAANLARQGRSRTAGSHYRSHGHLALTSPGPAGPDLLTLTIGSDIGRYPSSPRPACRGYLYKRTQSGLIKGWRKRWFVLTHERCLCYYRHRRVSNQHRLHKQPHHRRRQAGRLLAYRTRASRGPCKRSGWRGPRSGPTRPWGNPSCSGAALRPPPGSSSSAPPPARR